MVQLFKYFFPILAFALCASAQALPSKEELEKQIGQLLIVGFDGTTISKKHQLYKDIQKYNLGGVILFEKDYKTKKPKNIQSPAQLKALTKSIKEFAPYPIFISIDQEGGLVSRLNPKNGFIQTPSANELGKLEEKQVEKAYKNLSQELFENSINLDFAPVVDLNLNPKNKVIVQTKRSYSKNPKEVAKYANIFIKELNNKNITAVLKHFPGHGSSLNDSHKGFVDITNTWTKKELEPYKLLKENRNMMIMTAHVVNKNLDKNYPATLSYNINTKLLKEKIGFKGLIISDDMQMKAITNHYSLKEAVTLALNAGVDILLFGNQLGQNSTKEIVQTIYSQIINKKIPYSKIKESLKKINSLHNK